MTTRIPIIGTLQQALQMVSTHRRDLLRVGLVFIIGFFALGIVFLHYLLPMFPPTMLGADAAAAPPAVDPRLPAAVLIMFVIEVLLFTVFSVGWHRAMLSGAERGQGAQLGARELRYFGRFWLCIVLCIAALLVMAPIEASISVVLHGDSRPMTWGAQVANILVALYIFARMGPSFASLSVDAPLNFRQSWSLTKGNGLRILAVHALAVFGWFVLNFLIGWFAGLLGLGESAPYTLLLVGDLTLCALMAVVVSINAIVFARLTGWKAPS